MTLPRKNFIRFLKLWVLSAVGLGLNQIVKLYNKPPILRITFYSNKYNNRKKKAAKNIEKDHKNLQH